MKKEYMKPSMKVYELQHKANILVGSPYDATPPNEIPDYDDWMASREDRRGNSHGVWGEEEEEE